MQTCYVYDNIFFLTYFSLQQLRQFHNQAYWKRSILLSHFPPHLPKLCERRQSFQIHINIINDEICHGSEPYHDYKSGVLLIKGLKMVFILYIFIAMIWVMLMVICALGNDVVLVRDCVRKAQGRCEEWSETIITKREESVWEQESFPASTLVLTPEGPKTLSALSTQDRILSFNPSTSSTQFTEVTGWLHHEPNSQAQYQQILTQSGNQYLASHSHNIAVEKDGQIEYSFAEELLAEDGLVSVPEGEVVVSANETVKAMGIFSPLTANYNFFIYARNSSVMILVHCFGQVHNPTQYQPIVGVGKWLGMGSTKHISHLLGVFSSAPPSHQLIHTQHQQHGSSGDDDPSPQLLTMFQFFFGQIILQPSQ